MTTREKEIAFFLHKRFGADIDPKSDVNVEFCDVNLSLKRLVQMAKLKNPWRSYCPTLTAKSSIIIRCFKDGVVAHMRKLSGDEHMALVGWPATELPTLREKYTSKLLCSLAGNAFSGFQIMPIVSAALVLAGDIGTPKAPNFDDTRGKPTDPETQDVGDGELESPWPSSEADSNSEGS